MWCQDLNEFHNKIFNEGLSSLKMFNLNKWGNYEYSFSYLTYLFIYAWIEYLINYNTCSFLSIINRDVSFLVG